MSLRRRMVLGILVGGGALRQARGQGLAEAAARRFPQPVRVGDLLHRQVLQPLESQPSLGRVQAVVMRPDGSIDVIMRYGSFLGFHARSIAVPVAALGLLGEYMVMLGLTPEQLDALPDDTGIQGAPLPPDTIIRVALAKPVH
jgi:hypothetical protein